MGVLSDKLGQWITRILQREVSYVKPFAPVDLDVLRSILMPGDVILVDGRQKISVAIKYLTQSSWSHAALYVGDSLSDEQKPVKSRNYDLVEVNLGKGCHVSSLAVYKNCSLRICRPIAMSEEDRAKVVNFMISKIGLKYDLRNIIDLMRYLLPTPPVPVRWRRKMIALGAGDPTRAICSSLIAQAFQTVPYPILPSIEEVENGHLSSSGYGREEIYHIRHHSLFTPRDFDLSPYFAVIKPTVETGFDYKKIVWGEEKFLDKTDETT